LQAADFGKSVAVIGHEHPLGGTAADTGTLPSKTLRGTSLFLAYATYDAPGRGPQASGAGVGLGRRLIEVIPGLNGGPDASGARR
jgi:pyruvate/2-oxoglutarate dehydrogenase complex dihydrolipoamide dehydrogenase (E3) component